MGAPLVVRFEHGPDREECSRVYLHWGGGYVDEIVVTMSSFFADVSELKDKRLDDPTYLAAKLVVWGAREGSRSDNPLDFLGVGIVESDGCGDGLVSVPCQGKIEYEILSAVDMDDEPITFAKV